jgi:hypothetical protein
MREAKAGWIAALRALTGQEGDTIRWNTMLARWEFVLTEADGVPRSQFWGWYHNPLTGAPLVPDEATGLYPFRDLDDATMQTALANLQRTFIGNPHDGAGTTQATVKQRMQRNRAHRRRQIVDAAELWADMAADRALRLRGGVQFAVPGTVATTLTP